MYNTTKTIYSIIQDTYRTYGRIYKPLPNTTLNEKFGITTDIIFEKNPVLSYYAIGLDYEDMLEDSDANIDNVRHEIYDGSLFRHAPLIARKKSIGFTLNELDKYRMFVEKDINGETYIFAFVKVIDTIYDSDKILLATSTDNNEPELSVFSTENTNTLNPTPKTRDDVLDSTIDYLTFKMYATVILDADELDELRNASKLLYGDDVNVSLGEVGFISGIDLTNGSNKELYNATIEYFVKVQHLLDDNEITDVFKKSVEIGGMTPKPFRIYW